MRFCTHPPYSNIIEYSEDIEEDLSKLKGSKYVHSYVEDAYKNVKKDLIEGPLKEHMAYYQNQGIDEKEAMKLVAKDRGISKSIIYQELKRK